MWKRLEAPATVIAAAVVIISAVANQVPRASSLFERHGAPLGWVLTAGLVAFIVLVLFWRFRYDPSRAAGLTAPAEAKPDTGLPEWFERIPYYLKPSNDRMWCANKLLEVGYVVRNAIPEREPPSPLVQSLAQTNPLMPDHFRDVANWDQSVYTFLTLRASECRGLFHRGHIPQTYSGLRYYMDSRLEELATIHGRLRG